MKFAFCGDDYFENVLSSILSEGHDLLALFTWPASDERFVHDRIVAIAARQQCSITMSPIVRRDIQQLKEGGCELLISASYAYRVPDLTDAVPYSVNVHPSPLPIGRGPWPGPWFFLKGLPTAGVTLHVHSREWDEGDILLKRKIYLTEYDNVDTLGMRTKLVAQDLVLDMLSDIRNIFERRVPQGIGEYWPRPTDEDRTIDASCDVEGARRRIRAFGSHGTFARTIDEHAFFLKHAIVWPEAHNDCPGRTLVLSDSELLISLKNGLLYSNEFSRVAS